MKHIGLLLHFYQPPTQDPDIVRRIDGECYRPVFSLLEEWGEGVTLNINYSLTEQLAELAPATLKALSRLHRCSFTGSGAYHPILPLIPGEETARQIRLNLEGNRRLIGDAYSPSGLFPPEMALDAATAKLIGEQGCSWTVTDDVPWVSSGGKAPWNRILSSGGVPVFLRSNFWSNRISFHGKDGAATALELKRSMEEWTGTEDACLVIAMDGETFGHHWKGGVSGFLGPFLKTLASTHGIKVSTMDEMLRTFPLEESRLPAGSWSTTPEDVAAGEPYPLWSHSKNRNHQRYWELLSFVLDASLEERCEGVAALADKMLYSCPLWWASSGRESYTQVRRGILMILEAALAGVPRGELLDRVMELAGRVPAMAGRDR